MKNTESLVSIILPVYRGEKYIINALTSIKEQTYKNYELIIIDDCCIDNSITIVENDLRNVEFNWILITHKENKGIAYSYNEALDIAKGKYISLLDEDDFYPKNKLEKQVNFLNKNQNYIAVGGKVKCVDEYGKEYDSDRYPLLDTKTIQATLMFENCICNCEMMFRKEILLNNSLKYEEYGFGLDDMGFWTRLSKYGPFYYLKDEMLYHRIHGNNSSIIFKNQYAKERAIQYKRIVERSLRESGMGLTEETIGIISSVLTEDKKRTRLNKKDSLLLKNVYNELLNKCDEKGIIYKQEIKRYLDNKIST